MLTNRIIRITLHWRPNLTSPYVNKTRLGRPSFILMHLTFSDVRPNYVKFAIRIITTTLHRYQNNFFSLITNKLIFVILTFKITLVTKIVSLHWNHHTLTKSILQKSVFSNLGPSSLHWRPNSFHYTNDFVTPFFMSPLQYSWSVSLR